MIFFSILQFAASSLFWGVLMAVALVALFVFIVRGWWKDALFTVWTYVTGAVLCVLLAYECTLMVGALKIRNSCDEFEAILTEIVDRYYPNKYMEVSAEKSGEMFNELAEKFPLLNNYVSATIEGSDINGSGYIYGEGYSAADLPHGMIAYLKEIVTEYMMHRIYWALGFAIVLGIIAILTIKKSSNSNLRKRNTERLDRHGSSRGTERISRDTRRISRRH